ncbi:MAG: prepilin-type N-terminal cleavage/methylation domain-containing protein [Pirellulales bacterium]|nr:prepilin-type N-terminal cleavage/methylation domain-containing protein [Pirellulales bacterium]
MRRFQLRSSRVPHWQSQWHPNRRGMGFQPMTDTARMAVPRLQSPSPSPRRGFTLVEMLVAVAITLLMMTTVVTVFGLVMDSISNSRSTIEMTDRLRAARNRLALDLQGATAPTTPPLSPDASQGYFEIIEGPIGAIYPAAAFATRSDEPADTSSGLLNADYTVGDNDDVLMLTVRSAAKEPFTGRFTPWNFVNDPSSQPPPQAVGDPVIVESRVAEVCWFLRGTTLYRRVLLVLPGPVAVQLPPGTPPQVVPLQPIPPKPLLDPSGTPVYRSYYALYDISARQEDGLWGLQATAPQTGAGPTGRLVANTLADLTKREHRYGHQPYAWPHDARFWGPLRLPTLRECSSPYWPFPFNDPTGGLSAAMGIAAPLPTTLEPLGRPLIVPNGQLNAQLLVTQVPQGASPAQYPPTVQLTPDDTIPIPAKATPHAIANSAFDAWRNPTPYLETQPLPGQSRTGELTHYISTSPNNAGNDPRVSEDIILTNVLEFDVKVWDPGAPVVEVAAPGGASRIAVSPNENWQPGAGPGGMDTWSSTAAIANAGQAKLVVEDGVIAGFGAFVDLNYFAGLPFGPAVPVAPYYPPMYPPVDSKSALVAPPAPLIIQPQFHYAGDFRSGVRGTHPQPAGLEPMGNTAAVVMAWPSAVYDTWSTHYEQDGIFQRQTWDPNASNWPIDAGTDGIDNDNQFGVDDPTEQEAPPPYTAPLRAIQIKLRVFDPDSRQIREVTLEHEFFPDS